MGDGTEIRNFANRELNLSEPNRFVDALIAQEIMGFSIRVSPIAIYRFIYQPTPGGIWVSVPFYSSDRGDALDLLKHLIPGYRGEPPAAGSPFYLVNIEGHTGGAPTFPLAVCKAALQAAGLYGNEKVCQVRLKLRTSG